MRNIAKVLPVVVVMLAVLVSAALSGCQKHVFTAADVDAVPAVVRLDGLEAVAADITEELIIAEAAEAYEGETGAADEERAIGVVAVLSRGDEVSVLVDADGNVLYTDDGRVGIRIGEVSEDGQEADTAPICALVDPRYLRFASDEPFVPYTEIALLGAATFGDFALSLDEQALQVDTEVEVVDEIDGVLLIGPEGAIRYAQPWTLTDERTSFASRVDGAEVYAGVLGRGDEVKIIGEHGEYYVVAFPGDREGAEFPALIEKWLVRPETASSPEGRSGYAVYNCAVYDSAFMTTAIATPAVDTVIEVLDEFNGVAYVRLPDGTEGYLPSGDVTATTNYVAPRPRSGGGSSSGGQDGGDISLSAYRFGAATAPAVHAAGGESVSLAGYLAGSEEGIVCEVDGASFGVTSGTVLSASVPVIWAFLDRGDAVHHMLGVDDDVERLQVALAGRTGWIEVSLMKSDSDEAFSPVDLYAQAGAVIYSDHHRTKQLYTCDRNDRIHAIDEYGDGYVVEYAPSDGETVIAYVQKSVTSDTEVPAPVVRPRSSGGGSGGGSQEWTDPVL